MGNSEIVVKIANSTWEFGWSALAAIATIGAAIATCFLGRQANRIAKEAKIANDRQRRSRATAYAALIARDVEAIAVGFLAAQLVLSREGRGGYDKAVSIILTIPSENLVNNAGDAGILDLPLSRSVAETASLLAQVKALVAPFGDRKLVQAPHITEFQRWLETSTASILPAARNVWVQAGFGEANNLEQAAKFRAGYA